MGLARSADAHVLAFVAVLVWPMHFYAVCLGYEDGRCPGLVLGGRGGRGRLGLSAIYIDDAMARIKFAGQRGVEASLRASGRGLLTLLGCWRR